MEVARFCEDQLPRAIAQGSCKDTRNALISAFHRMDELLGDEEIINSDFLRSYSNLSTNTAFLGSSPVQNMSADWMGCTCVVVLLRPDVIVVANAGDSRAVLSRRRQAIP